MNLDIKNLEPKKELNPKFWKGPAGEKLDEGIRKQLLKIALFFRKELALELSDIKDILITGSIANFNWSKYSDIDLHILVDFDKINIERDLLEDYFKAKKNLWNNLHDITTHGHEVEVYVQDSKEPHQATGQYSLIKDDWLVKPTGDFKDFDEKVLKDKTQNIMKLIDFIEETLQTNPLHAMKMSDMLQDRLKKMRSAGLEEHGEYAIENLTYKLLRRQGYLDKLYDIDTDGFDKLMSLPAPDKTNDKE